MYDMIVLKYGKCGEACFISHIDLLRHVSRILRRAEIPVNFSNGFHPHALVYFSPPLVLGAQSEAEYLTVDTPMSARDALSAFNAAVPETLRASCAFEVDKNPNIQGLAYAADFVFDAPFADLGENIEITYDKKGENITENVGDKIFGAFNEDGKLKLRLASGNVSLRPDRLLPLVRLKTGKEIAITDVRKTAQFVRIQGGVKDVDAFLKEISGERPAD